MVVPETCKLPVITIVSPGSVPITIFSSDVPPPDSSAANLVNKFAFDISSNVGKFAIGRVPVTLVVKSIVVFVILEPFI